ncbi:MAG: class I SAM-dependent methyltransferase [Chloroflexi bacterium]|nr:class I SAM-dependent methyltransferase [Chloroflexota bacterium]
MANPATQTIYDQIPYPSLSFSWSHPSHLATLAVLVGMQPAPVERCRVLELGCAGGGNLIPMAYSLPDSEFIGIDLSARQIAEGQEMVAALGLRNVSLKQTNILGIASDFGRFDYIIAHGISVNRILPRMG